MIKENEALKDEVADFRMIKKLLFKNMEKMGNLPIAPNVRNSYIKIIKTNIYKNDSKTNGISRNAY